MFEKFFSKKKEKPFLSVANFNIFLNEKNTKNEKNENELKGLLEKIINSPEFYIENSQGKKLVGQEFDSAREIIWKNLNRDNKEMRKIEEALNQNKLSYNRTSQLSLVIELAREKSINVDDLAERLSFLVKNIDSKKYSELTLEKKESFMTEIDKMASNLYDRL